MRERVIFLNDPEDLAWLREVHVPEAPPFKAAILYGNEDWPARVDLYGDAEPLVTDMAMVYISNTDGDLIFQGIGKIDTTGGNEHGA